MGGVVRLLITIVLALVVGACHGPLIQNLPLEWKGQSPSQASASVALALRSVPIAFWLRDMRSDPSAIGRDQETGHIVRTTDDVGRFASQNVGGLLRAAGGRFEQPPVVVIGVDLTELSVVEGDRFNGAAALLVTVTRGGQPIYTKPFRGTSSRWGSTHSPENFNEALSVALESATAQLLQDEAFAAALTGQAMAPPAPMPPVMPPPADPAAPAAPPPPTAPAAPPPPTAPAAPPAPSSAPGAP